MIRGAQISWSSRKQSIMTLSSCETEYVAASYNMDRDVAQRAQDNGT